MVAAMRIYACEERSIDPNYPLTPCLYCYLLNRRTKTEILENLANTRIELTALDIWAVYYLKSRKKFLIALGSPAVPKLATHPVTI